MPQEPNDVATIPAPAPVLPGLQELLNELHIEDWDVLLLGDGSGSQWVRGYGWACVLVERNKLTPKVFYGGGSAGTNFISELEAYIRPLLWYSEGPGKKVLKHRVATPGCFPLGQVHIVTDCKTLVEQGNGKVRREKNKPLWAAIESVASQGFMLNWHWMPREATALNRWADRQSRLMRTTLARIEGLVQEDLHNPDDLYNERFGLRNKA